MKGIFFLLATTLICFDGGATPPKKIEVSYDNVVIIVFGEKVEKNYVNNVSIGNPEAVSFSYKENKIVLQALEENFIPTNMIVEIANGALYVYRVVFNNTPSNFLIKEGAANADIAQKVQHVEPKKEKTKKLQESITSKVELVKEKKDYLHGVGEIKSRMKVWLTGIWTDNFKHYFLKVSMLNSSNVDCRIGGTSVYVEKKKKLKRSVSVREELKQYINHDNILVKGKEESTFILVIDLITITKGKKLVVDIWEGSPGERRFTFYIDSKELLEANVI